MHSRLDKTRLLPILLRANILTVEPALSVASHLDTIEHNAQNVTLSVISARNKGTFRRFASLSLKPKLLWLKRALRYPSWEL